MTVRYKSATVDEFIEHHSHDVSRGGIFIKTPQPFPPGTLLKFEIRIQDEQSVLAGVGRVVWKRDSGDASGSSPTGMGVKFIKIDDKSKALIQRLVDSQEVGTTSTFEAGKSGEGGAEEAAEEAVAAVAPAVATATAAPAATPAPAAAAASTPAATAAAKTVKRGATMLGLGSIGGAKGAEPRADAKPIERKEAASFFPTTNPDKEMPPPEERTVMKQAAELLKQALAEAGASLDDLNAGFAIKEDEPPAKEEPKEEAKPVVEAKEEAKLVAKEEAKEEAADAKEAAKPAAKDEDEAKAKAVIVAVVAVKEETKAAAKEKDEAVEAKPAPKAEAKPKPAADKPKETDRTPAAKPAPKPMMQPPQDSGGSGRLLTILLIVAGLGGAAWLLFGNRDQPGSSGGATPEKTMVTPPAPTPTPVVTQTAAPSVTVAMPPPSASAAMSASVAPSASAAPPAAKTVATPPPVVPTPATTPKPVVTTPPPVTTPKPTPAKPPPPKNDLPPELQ